MEIPQRALSHCDYLIPGEGLGLPRIAFRHVHTKDPQHDSKSCLKTGPRNPELWSRAPAGNTQSNLGFERASNPEDARKVTG